MDAYFKNNVAASIVIMNFLKQGDVVFVAEVADAADFSVRVARGAEEACCIPCANGNGRHERENISIGS